MTGQPNRIIVAYYPYNVGNKVLLPAIGRRYSENNEFITREDRAADGTLRRDIIAAKKTFTLSYDAIDIDNLAIYDDLISNYAHSELKLSIDTIIPTGTRNDIYTVLIMPYSRERLQSLGGGLWGGVTVSFVEV